MNSDPNDGRRGTQTNRKLYEEEKTICDALRELFADELIESEQRGTEKGEFLRLISQVCKKIKKGQSVDKMADALETTPAQIAPIVEAAESCAPEYDTENIYQILTGK